MQIKATPISSWSDVLELARLFSQMDYLAKFAVTHIGATPVLPFLLNPMQFNLATGLKYYASYLDRKCQSEREALTKRSQIILTLKA